MTIPYVNVNIDLRPPTSQQLWLYFSSIPVSQALLLEASNRLVYWERERSLNDEYYVDNTISECIITMNIIVYKIEQILRDVDNCKC